jgi:hypothetical protein
VASMPTKKLIISSKHKKLIEKFLVIVGCPRADVLEMKGTLIGD